MTGKMSLGPWVLEHIDGDRYWMDWRDDDMGRTISQILDEAKVRSDRLQSDLFDAEARTEQVRETLRRVVAHARREHQDLKKWIELKSLREFQLKACAAGPWHPATETPPKEGLYLIRWRDGQIDLWTYNHALDRWDATDDSEIFSWAEIRRGTN
jgi:hypothetical protein